MNELDYWNGRLIKGAISRREFMGRAAALGASGLAISTLLASAATAADAPKSGGVLKLGLAGGSTTDSLDFRTTTDSVMIGCNHGIWNCLAKWDQGRQTPSGIGGELGARQWRKGLDCQAAEGRHLLQWQGVYGRRRNLFPQPSPGRYEIWRRDLGEGRHRHQEA